MKRMVKKSTQITEKHSNHRKAKSRKQTLREGGMGTDTFNGLNTHKIILEDILKATCKLGRQP